MAFGGILLINIVLWFVLGAGLIGLASIITATVMGFIHLIRKRKEKPTKKWLPITAIVLTITGILALLPLAILIIISA